MSGVVRFRTHRGEPAEAILDDEGRWHCPRLPVLDRVLNILYAPERSGSAGLALRRAARWLKGTVAAEAFAPEAEEPAVAAW